MKRVASMIDEAAHQEKAAAQEKAVAAAEAALAAGGRAQVVMACGTGKTRVAAQTSHRLTPHGRVLVVVPTLELLRQTVAEWRDHLGGAVGRMTAVCSESGVASGNTTLEAQEITELEDSGLLVSTDPGTLHADLHPEGRVTVLVTYASLPTIAALASDYGLPAWDLVVVDEAHRSAGAAGRAWSIVHDDTCIPAHRRLYMTATPRIYDGSDVAAMSMDDETTFGPCVYETTFVEAIEAGILADYRLVVAVVTDAEVARLTDGSVVTLDGAMMSARLLAAQIALTRAIDQYGLSRVITYHSSIANAQHFAGSLLGAADLVYRPEGARRIAPYQVDGTTGTAVRRHTLDHLRRPGDRAVVVSNCKVLGEGIDVPELDGVMFVDPRDSGTDVIQAVGRALRCSNEKQSKVATVVVPVLIGEHESADAAMDGDRWSTVWRIVRALRAHDERVAEELDRHRTRYGTTSGNLIGHDEARWIVSGTSITREFADAIHLKLVNSATSPWLDGYAAAQKFHAEHGHLDVPTNYRDDQGFHLGSWINNRRAEYRAGHIAPKRIAMLEELCMVWDPQEQQWRAVYEQVRAYVETHGALPGGSAYLGRWLSGQRYAWRRGRLSAEQATLLTALGVEPHTRLHARRWEQGLAAARAFAEEYGHLDVPVAGKYEGFALGAWLNTQRKKYRKHKLSADQIAQLEAIGIVWHPKRRSWEQGLAAARSYWQAHGHLAVPVSYTTEDGFALGKWIAELRARKRGSSTPPLSQSEITALEELGMVWQIQRRNSPDRD